MLAGIRKLMIILAALLIVLLYINFKFIQNVIYGSIDESITIAAFKARKIINPKVPNVVYKVTKMPPVNNKHVDPQTAKRPCDELYKLYSKYAKLNNLSDFDIDCLMQHYDINGIQYLDRTSKLSFLKCNPDYTRYGYKGGFEQYLDVKPTDLGNCTKLSDMHFINGTRVITLVSLPGSGNTWTRLLLEQATGIFTGSIFCDQDLRSSGFFGEQIISSNVLAVKTHYPGIGKPKFNHFNPAHVDGTIFIMRNPLDSIVAERKRQILRVNKHTGDVGPQYFGTNKDWVYFVHTIMRDTFPALVRYWLDEVNIPTLVIKYEDMVNDLQTQLKKMLHFLQVPYSKEQVECVLKYGMNRFHRRKTTGFDHYTPELRKLVVDGLKNVEPILNKHNITYRNVIYNDD